MSRQFEHLGIDWTMSLASSPLAKKTLGFAGWVCFKSSPRFVWSWNCLLCGPHKLTCSEFLTYQTWAPQHSFPKNDRSPASHPLHWLHWAAHPQEPIYTWNVTCFWNPGSLFTELPSSQNITSHRGGQHHDQHMSTLFLPAPCRQLVPGCCVCSDQSYHCRTTLLEFSDVLVRWLAMTHALVHESTFFLVRNQQNMATQLGTKSFRELFNLWDQRPLLHGSTSTVFAQAHIESSNSCG